jgi:sugar phosphate isomerase/epimerase
MTATRFRVAVAAESLTPWFEPAQVLRHIADLGCRDVQLCASLFANRIAFGASEVWELRRRLDALGLRAESMSTFPYRMDAARYVDFLRRVIRAASVLDLRVMNIYLFPFLSAGDDDETAITRFAQAIRPLADEAMACSLTFCLEPEYFDLTRDVSGLRRVLDAVAHPGLRLTFDACNLYQGGEEAFPYAYESLRAHIGHVHLKNGSVFIDGRHPPDEKAFAFAPPNEHRTMRWGPLEDGALNIHALLARLRSDAYDGVVVLEPHTRNADKQLDFLGREFDFVTAHSARG